MNIFLIKYVFSMLFVNSIKVADCNNESISHLFENDESEFKRNVNMGILCHTYNFNRIKFYENDTRSEFISYLDNTKTMVTDRPTMTYVSIILYHIPNIKILRSEVYKIVQFILSQEDFDGYPNNIKNLYKLEITKINPKKQKIDLFNKLPDCKYIDINISEKLTQNVLYIFLLEDIKKNKMIKNILRNVIEKFFYIGSPNSNNFVMMKTLIIEAIYLPEYNIVNYMNSRFNSNLKLMASINHIFFVAFELLENSNTYFQNNIEISHQRDIYDESKNYKTRFYLQNNRSSLSLYKKSDIKNLDYYIKYMDKNIEFGIYKCIDTNNTYTKLLNFLGYSPLETSYGIKISIKNDIQCSHFFEIKVLIYKNIIIQANNQVPEISKYIKQIIVSKINNDNTYSILIDYSYEINTHGSEGFPLFNVERETIQDKEYNKNMEAKKLINFIDFYESFMYGRHYLYFKDIYSGIIDFNNDFCFYKREIYFKYLTIFKIHKILENSLNLQIDVNLRKNYKIFSTLKTIEIFDFKRNYTRNKGTINSQNNIKVLKGFNNHHFFDIELCFYSDIQMVNYYNCINEFTDINYFIKVDFGFNNNYFIFFKEVPNNWTNNDKFYNFKQINYQADKFLKPIINELLSFDDGEEAEKHTLNFIGAIFNLTKMYLNDNFELKKNFCYKLRQEVRSFLPRTHKLIYIFLDIANNSETQISSRKTYLITELFQTSIAIIKRNFLNMLYEACVIRSISNKADNSKEILENLL